MLVERAEVAGVEPAVVLEHLGGGGGVVPVAAEDVRAHEQDLAVVGDVHRSAGERPTDRADAQRGGAVDGRRAGGLGEAVALEDRDADAAEEVPEPDAQRGAARHRPGDPPAHRGAELGVDEPVEQRVLQAQAEAGAAGSSASL